MEQYIPLLVNKDPVFQTILDKYGFPLFPSRPQGFESMCKTILEQQVSLNSARASYNKLQAYVQYINPPAVLKLTDEEFRTCGISRQKSTYLRSLAQAVQNGDIDFSSFALKPVELVRQELINVKGIGNWTIDVYLIFSLRSQDILPLGDIGIISAMKDLLGLTSVVEMEEYAKRWSPYRTTAAFLLWHYYLEKRGRKFPH